MGGKSAETRISFLQSGGFTGCRKGCEIGASALGGTARAALKTAWALGPAARRSSAGRDLVEYRISLRRGRERHDLHFDDLTVPVPLRPLVRVLLKRAKARRLMD